MFHAGRYKAVVTSQALGESKEKKTPQFVLTIKPEYAVIDGVEHPVDVPQERRMYFYFSEKTIDRTVQELQSLGFNRESFGELDPDVQGHFDFRNLEIDVVCEHENYNGKPAERWQLAMSRGAAPIAKLDQQGIRKLDALFGKHLKSTPAVRPPANRNVAANPRPASTVTAPPTPALDDKIPF